MVTRFTRYASQVSEATPEGRDRYVDLLRAVAIVAVVLGHWMVASVESREDGRLDGVSILNVAEWIHGLTWLFYVMPIFFLVGGYANAISWQRHRAAGGGWPAWVHRRSVRLLWPTAVFVGGSVLGVAIAHLVGVDARTIDLAGWVAGIALWFLVVYLAIAALTPLTYRLHERFGLAPTLLMFGALAVGDIARAVTLDPQWAIANYAFGWGLFHQVGYWWRDGALPSSTRRALLVSALGGVVLVGLVVLGPWPVSMVNVPDVPIQNSSPPSLALLALAVVQTGIVLAAADRARAWLRQPVVWATVVTLNRVILTLFLWHMVALVVGAGLLYGTGLLPEPDTLGGAWFAWRPIWILTLTLIVAGFVAVLGPLEQRAAQPLTAARQSPLLGGTLVAVGVAVACYGLSELTLNGLAGDGPLGIPTLGLASFALGTLMTTLAGRFAPQPSRAGA